MDQGLLLQENLADLTSGVNHLQGFPHSQLIHKRGPDFESRASQIRLRRGWKVAGHTGISIELSEQTQEHNFFNVCQESGPTPYVRRINVKISWLNSRAVADVHLVVPWSRKWYRAEFGDMLPFEDRCRTNIKRWRHEVDRRSVSSDATRTEVPRPRYMHVQ